MRLTLAASCFCAALASAWPADAGQAEGPGRQAQLAENIDDAPTFGFDFWPDILDPREWDLTLGVVGGVVPDFPGADSYSFRATPHVRIVWHDRLFVKNETAGVNLIKTRDLKLGLSVKRAPTWRAWARSATGSRRAASCASTGAACACICSFTMTSPRVTGGPWSSWAPRPGSAWPAAPGAG
jgi:hypothetical protein